MPINIIIKKYPLTYTHTYIHTYIHTYTHTFMYACMHAYVHTYIHIFRSYKIMYYLVEEESFIKFFPAFRSYGKKYVFR